MPARTNLPASWSSPLGCPSHYSLLQTHKSLIKSTETPNSFLLWTFVRAVPRTKYEHVSLFPKGWGFFASRSYFRGHLLKEAFPGHLRRATSPAGHPHPCFISFMQLFATWKLSSYLLTFSQASCLEGEFHDWGGLFCWPLLFTKLLAWVCCVKYSCVNN